MIILDMSGEQTIKVDNNIKTSSINITSKPKLNVSGRVDINNLMSKVGKRKENKKRKI